MTIAGVLSAVHAANPAGSCGYVVCSEQTFSELAGSAGYTAIDVQVSEPNDDAAAAAVRNLLPADSTVSDKRLRNSESRSAYYTGAIFIYGFLTVIALITVVHIFNSMSASAASRTRQYGMMRSIGMGAEQLSRMIAAEAFTYAVSGLAAGCGIGLPLSYFLHTLLITRYFGKVWHPPVAMLCIIVVFMMTCAAVAVYAPAKRIRNMAITETINEL